MSPFLAVDYIPRVFSGDAELLGNLRVGHIARCSKSANIKNGLGSQSAIGVKFTEGFRGKNMLDVTALIDCIKHVVLVCSRPQMMWIDTSAIVAGVTHEEIVGVNTAMKYVGNYGRLVDMAVHIKASVSLAFAAKPLPTFGGRALINLLPESLFELLDRAFGLQGGYEVEKNCGIMRHSNSSPLVTVAHAVGWFQPSLRQFVFPRSIIPQVKIDA